jgi:hypothetical protein
MVWHGQYSFSLMDMTGAYDLCAGHGWCSCFKVSLAVLQSLTVIVVVIQSARQRRETSIKYSFSTAPNSRDPSLLQKGCTSNGTVSC